MSDSLQPMNWAPARLLCPWDFPDKNFGVGCYFLLQGIFPTTRIEPAYPALTGRFFTTEPPGKQSLLCVIVIQLYSQSGILVNFIYNVILLLSLINHFKLGYLRFFFIINNATMSNFVHLPFSIFRIDF